MKETIKGYLGDKYRPEDDELITLYCETRAMYIDMLAELRTDGLMVNHTNAKGATNKIKHPLAIEVTKTAQVLNTLLKSLGLTTSQRKEIGETRDEFTDF